MASSWRSAGFQRRWNSARPPANFSITDRRTELAFVRFSWNQFILDSNFGFIVVIDLIQSKCAVSIRSGDRRLPMRTDEATASDADTVARRATKNFLLTS